MATNSYPIFDGIAPSWADVVARMTTNGGVAFETEDIKAINTGTSLEIGEQRGASGGRVLRRTTGAASQEASITFYKSGYQKFLRTMKAEAPLRGNQRRIALVHFDVQVLWTPEGESDIFETRIKGARIKGRTMNTAEGNDADEVEVPLSVIEIADMIDGEEVVLL